MRKYFSIFLFFSLFSCESYFFDKYNIVQPKIYNYEDNIYTVKKGDNLYSISKSFNLPIQKIIKSNKIKFPFKIYPNQKIFLPKNKNYIFKKGDTLYSISRKFKTDVFALANFNKLNNINQIKVDQKILIPDSELSFDLLSSLYLKIISDKFLKLKLFKISNAFLFCFKSKRISKSELTLYEKPLLADSN